MRNARTIETKIRRLKREISAIDEAFYQTNETDNRDLFLGMLERKRDDMIRAAVLQLHTSIEDVLDAHLTWRILGVKSDEARRARGKSAHALRRMLSGSGSIGFDMKLNLAVALKIVSPKRKDRLAVLNTIRNKCSHHWLLKAPQRRGKRPRQLKPPLLLYKGRDLHGVSVFKEFIAEFGVLHALMFVKYLD